MTFPPRHTTVQRASSLVDYPDLAGVARPDRVVEDPDREGRVEEG